MVVISPVQVYTSYMTNLVKLISLVLGLRGLCFTTVEASSK